MTSVAATAGTRPGAGWGLGETLALVSAAGYATVNALLRSVATDVDPFVAALVRQVPLLLLASSAVLLLRPAVLRPRSETFLGPRTVAFLMAAGTVSFVLGNVLLMQGFSWVGLALATAAMQGGMVVGGALISWLALHEPPTRQQTIGIAVVVVGLAVTAAPALSGGLGTGWDAALGFIFSAVAGACYTANGAASRHVQRGRKAFLATLFLTNLGGLVLLVVICLVRTGGDAAELLAAATGPGLGVVLLAGVVNAVAIGAITLAVRHTSVASTSVVSSSVLVFSTVLAWLVFHEDLPATLLVGCAVIVAGVVLGQLRPGQPGRTTPSSPKEKS